jgi:hypothetical protein
LLSERLQALIDVGVIERRPGLHGPDGSNSLPFGPAPKGILMLTADGHFTILALSSHLPMIASNDRMSQISDQDKAITQGSVGAFGSFKIDEARDILEEHVDGSTFPSGNGQTQSPVLKLISADERSWTESAGVAKTKLIFKRAS